MSLTDHQHQHCRVILACHNNNIDDVHYIACQLFRDICTKLYYSHITLFYEADAMMKINYFLRNMNRYNCDSQFSAQCDEVRRTVRINHSITPYSCKCNILSYITINQLICNKLKQCVVLILNLQYITSTTVNNYILVRLKILNIYFEKWLMINHTIKHLINLALCEQNCRDKIVHLKYGAKRTFSENLII